MTKKTTVYSQNIEIKGASVHNLKNISLNIPRNKFIVITGVSGSGKSSLAFDTLYADGQRRYVESLSAYARQFMGRINKPRVDYIKGIPPAIAIEQKVNTVNPRSTVGTSTEIYDYLKLLYARVGETFSPISGDLVEKHSVGDVIEYINTFPEGSKLMIMSPMNLIGGRKISDQLNVLLQQGFSRIEVNNKVVRISDLENPDKLTEKDSLFLVIDRLSFSDDEDNQSRMADSLETAFYEGHGRCLVKIFGQDKTIEKEFSNTFEADGIEFEMPSVHMFSFNNPLGACKTCEGFGKVIGIDEDLVAPDKSLSIYEDAIACWRGEKMSEWKNELISNASAFNFPIHKPYYELSEDERHLLWTGNRYFSGLNKFFKYLESKQYKIQYRVMLSRYRGKTVCPDCKGTRLKKEAFNVKFRGKTIQDLVLMPVSNLDKFFREESPKDTYSLNVAGRMLEEIRNRLEYLLNVGLGYLTLNRLSSTLSGGESQRINLAKSIGSSLVGSLYILDEPSIGLHSRDSIRLINVLKKLRDIGNTVIVVEHDREIIEAADHIIDIGPLAGQHGGEVVFNGPYDQLIENKESLTSQYINEFKKIPVPQNRRKANHFLEITGARENNLKNLNVRLPLNSMCVVTGVSGSGKSTLIDTILYPALKKIHGGFAGKTGKFDLLKGDIKAIRDTELVDQNPIGKSSRSNPVTYIKAFDEIRKLFADQPQAKHNGYKPSHFSFNVDGGRCEACKGDGEIKIEMQFMADIYLTCENCQGRRFKQDILDVTFEGKSIFDVLEMTVNESIEFFKKQKNTLTKKIAQKLQPLADVGLGYVKLGQPSNTLSGGESQRIKLASFLSIDKSEPCLYIFDEPTTGLHFDDINKLLKAFNALLDKGHSIIIIEHNTEVIKNADWIIDLGPEGGENGGHIVFEGTPEEIVKCKESYTGKYLKREIQ